MAYSCLDALNPSFSVFQPKSSNLENPQSTPGTNASEGATPDSTIEKAIGVGLEDESQELSRDPLNWFGILVPPALRESQQSFMRAATANIPALASTVKEMREMESEIRRVRKKLRKVT